MAGNTKDNQHVRVYVRVRPLSLSEKRGRNVSVLECSSNTEVKVRERINTVKTKTFKFDQVFGTGSTQIEVYQSILSPLIDEVLSGYNCTVFAYGQTGSGKTFTMVGERSRDPNVSWDVDPLCGLIPRSLNHLFDKLVNVEENYVVRVSYLELYNEELIDLLSKNDDVPKLKLYEDSTRKGGVIVHGLEEVEVRTKDEIYHILEKGSRKKRMAATLMNAHSSRSHTVFTIIFHIKETSSTGDIIKTGRLNLVDLAGSENIGRSGSIDKRAREAGNINQALLALGRVVTALTENAPHIPYRESKLTRLLQESLGGCTKTSIIATVTSASSNLDETLSTLEYACRARKITIKPKINQKLTKTAVIKEFTEEIERLRRELLCNREKSGVYLRIEDYTEMLVNLEHLQEENESISANMNNLIMQKQLKEELFDKVGKKIEKNIKKQQELSNVLSQVTTECYEKSHLLDTHVETEQQLTDHTRLLKSVADESSSHVNELHNKLSHLEQVEDENVQRCDDVKVDILQRLGNVLNQLEGMEQACIESHIQLKTAVDNFCGSVTQNDTILQETIAASVTQSEEAQQKIKKDNFENVTEAKQMGEQVVSSVVEAKHSSSKLQKHCKEHVDALLKEAADKVAIVAKSNEELGNLQWWQYLEKSQQMVEAVNALQNAMQHYQELDLQEYLAIQQTLEDMLQEQLQVNNALECLDGHLGKVAESVQAQSSDPKKCTTESKTLESLKTSIVKMFEGQAEAYRNQSDTCVAQCRQVAAEVGAAEENTLPHLVSAEQTLANLDVASSDYVKNYDAAWKECTRWTEEEIDHLQEQTLKSEQECLQHTQTIDSIVKDRVSSCTSVVLQQEDSLVKFSNHCREYLDSQGNSTNERALQMSNEIEQIDEQVEEFVNTGLCKELRTGKTPERCEFQYPLEIARSSPDEHILDKFRSLESYNPSDAVVEAESIVTSTDTSPSSSTSKSNSSLAKCLDSEDVVFQQKAASTSNIEAHRSADLGHFTVSEPVLPSDVYEKENQEVKDGVPAVQKTISKHSKKNVRRVLVPKNC